MRIAASIAGFCLVGLLVGCTPETTDPEPTPTTDVQIETTQLPSCADPAPSPGAFDDGRSGSGIDFEHVVIPPVFDNTPQDDDPFNGAFGGGVVAADLDGDGAEDLFFAQEEGANRLYWGLGDGSFEPAEATLAATVGLEDSRSLYTNTADFDGDGQLDLMVTGYQDLHLFQNQGGRAFVDRTDDLGIAAPAGYPGGIAWGDYDRDGDLDLFVGSYGVMQEGPDANFNGPDVLPSHLYRNDDGLFTDVSASLVVEAGQEGACLHAAFRDFDDDGDPDLLQVNDFGPWRGMTRLWENIGPSGDDWTWTNRHPESGIGDLTYPMGSLFRDLDGDQHPDLWFSNIGQTRLFRATAEWEWVDVGAVWAGDLNDGEADVSWSVVDIDLDGDGRAEVYINYGPHMGAEPPPEWGEAYEADQPDRLLVNTAEAGDEPDFQLAPDVFPTPQIGNARGTAIADLDDNGVPDLITSSLGSTPSILLGRCTDANRLVVRLQDGTQSNRSAVGAKVTVETAQGVQEQEVSAGGRGSFSGSEPQLFFGLGTAETVELLSVRWPDGATDAVESLCSHCQVVITRSP